MYKEAKLGEVQGTMLFKIWYWIENYLHYFSPFNGSSLNLAVRLPASLPRGIGLQPVQICKICGIQIGKGTVLFLNTTVFPK